MRFSSAIIGYAFFSFIAVHSTHGQTFSDDLLLENVGARGAITGSSHAANTADVHAALWNAAGLSQINTQNQGSFTYANALNSRYDQLMVNAAFRVDSNVALGIGWSNLFTGNAADTRLLFPGRDLVFDNVGTFSSNDQVFYLSMGSKISKIPGLHVGATWRMHFGQVEKFSNKMGFGLDLGAQYVKNSWRFGTVLKGVFGDYRHWSYNTSQLAETFAQTGVGIYENRLETFRPRLVLAVSKQIQLGKNVNFIPTVDFQLSADNRNNGLVNNGALSLVPNLGAMFELFQKIQIGGGVSQLNQQEIPFSNTKEWQLTPHAGVGLALKKMNIHYAWRRNILGENTFSNHCFTFIFSF